jgi:hypothetical protein
MTKQFSSWARVTVMSACLTRLPFSTSSSALVGNATADKFVAAREMCQKTMERFRKLELYATTESTDEYLLAAKQSA